MKNILAFFESLPNNWHKPNVHFVNKYNQNNIYKLINNLSSLEPHLHFNSTTYKLYIIL